MQLARDKAQREQEARERLSEARALQSQDPERAMQLAASMEEAWRDLECTFPELPDGLRFEGPHRGDPVLAGLFEPHALHLAEAALLAAEICAGSSDRDARTRGRIAASARALTWATHPEAPTDDALALRAAIHLGESLLANAASPKRKCPSRPR